MSLNLNILKYTPPIVDNHYNVVYRDLHLDIITKYTKNDEVSKKNEITDIVSDVNYDAINNSIYNILSTSPGQKILNPEFGLNFSQWLFTNMSENGALVITQTITHQINAYEPRVTLEHVSVIPDYEQNQYNIIIKYNINQIFKATLNEFGLMI